jgi:hypothetical protein
MAGTESTSDITDLSVVLKVSCVNVGLNAEP